MDNHPPLTAAEAARRLRVDTRTIYVMCRRKDLPYFRVGTGPRAPYRFRVADIEAIEAGEVRP